MSAEDEHDFVAAAERPARRQWSGPVARTGDGRKDAPAGRAVRRTSAPHGSAPADEGPRCAAVQADRGLRPRQRVPTAARTAHGPSAVVVQPPQQQPLLLAGRRSTRMGRSGAAGVASCIERCTAVSYVRISRGQYEHQVHQEGVARRGTGGLRQLTDLPACHGSVTEDRPASPGRSPAGYQPACSQSTSTGPAGESRMFDSNASP